MQQIARSRYLRITLDNQDNRYTPHPTRAIGHANRHERRYQRQPIESKESYKWLRSAEQSQSCFQDGGAKLVTHIGDRESDIYEEWATVPNAQTHLLVRARKDRRLWNQEVSLYEHLEQQPSQGTCSVEIITDPRVGRTTREAWLSIRATRVEIRRPDKLKHQDYPESLSLYAVEAQEINTPNGQAPIHWRLLTTHQVLSLEQALQIIEWYRWRWRIEQLFAILKQAGLNLEATQLESTNAIEKLTILALSVAVRILQLYQGRENTDLSSAIAFNEEQQQCLQQLAPSLKGRTSRQQNPYPHSSLAWASWLIARLGGWSGYRSQSPPGILTLLQGLRKFESLFEGWKMAWTKFS